MPKMTHPNQPRPLSVQEADVAARIADGWALVDAPAPTEPQVAKKTAEKTAVTRKSATTKKK